MVKKLALIVFIVGVVGSFLAGIFGLVHHYVVTSGIWFQWADMKHHEPLIAMCFVCCLSLMIGYFLRRK